MEQEKLYLNFGDLTCDKPPFNLNIRNLYKRKIENALNTEKNPSPLEMMGEHYAFFGQLNKITGIDEEEYVTRAAIISCSLGSKDIKLDAYEDHGVIAANEEPLMTCEDCQVNKNIYSFGTCNCPVYNNSLLNINLPHPTEIGVSGVETRVKYRCLPILSKKWMQKEGNLSVSDWTGEKFVEALRSGAYLTCLYGGLITVKGIPVKDDLKFIANGRIVTFPDIVNGRLNGEKKTLKPTERWASCQNKSDSTEIIDGITYYHIAVGPKLIDPQYPDNGKLEADDFGGSLRVFMDVHLTLKDENKDLEVDGKPLEQHKIVPCIATQLKAHCYNIHPDKTEGQKHKIFEYNKNITASFDVENGILQTGIAYPNSHNAQQDDDSDGPIAVEHIDGSIIEFLTPNYGFSAKQYNLEMVVVFD